MIKKLFPQSCGLFLIALFALGTLIFSATAQDSETASLESSEQTSKLLFNDLDLLFLHHMIMHHRQAVEMAPMVAEHSKREEFIRFAGYVARAQVAEIDMMQSLLDLAAKRGQQVPEHPPHGDPPMHGMLSSAQMDALRAARGDEFERLWLEGMIFHHQGAIDMSQMQQKQQLTNGRRPYGLSVLVEDIIVEQRAEITRMKAWLKEWGLVSTP